MGEWDLDKKKSFAKTMGKHVKRPRFARGGRVKFADGGDAGSDGAATGAEIGTVGGPITTGIGAGVGYLVGSGAFDSGDGPGGLAPSLMNALGLGNDFQAQSANIHSGTNAQQLQHAYDLANQGIGLQQDFYANLQGQNGIGNQSSVFNQQQALAHQLGQYASGQGPNPALNQLATTTGQNVQNQAALMASQRGAGANVGLMARNAAMQGAATQQHAAGQAATLASQQQIAYTQALQAQQQAMGNTAQNQVNEQGQALTGLNTATQNEQNILQSANTAFNNASVANQSNINNVNAQISQGNQQMAGTVLGGAMAGGSSMMSSMMAKGGKVKNMDDGGEVEANFGNESYTQPSNTGSIDIGHMGSTDVSSGLAKEMSSSGGGGGGGGGGAGLGMLAMAASRGGQVPHMDMGGTAVNFGQAQYTPPSGGGGGINTGSMNATNVGAGLDSQLKNLGNKKQGTSEEEEDDSEEEDDDSESLARGGPVSHVHFDNHFMRYFSGGKSEKIPAMVSPGEIYLNPDEVKKVIHEGANPLKMGQKIHGKAKVKGDSLKNDTVPKTLEEGGVVIPRHIAATKKMSREKAELFVHRAMARKKSRG